MGEQVYFQLNKDQELKLKVPKNPDAAAEDKVYLVPKRKDEIALSTTDCGVKDGCDVTIKSKTTTDNMLILSNKNF